MCITNVFVREGLEEEDLDGEMDKNWWLHSTTNKEWKAGSMVCCLFAIQVHSLNKEIVMK